MAIPRFLALFLLGTLINSGYASKVKEILRQSKGLGHRQERLFSLFNVVKFKNEACQGTSSNGNVGTCLNTQECSQKGGNSIGNCAAGFGVCCVIAITGCGGTVSNNCTYVRNNGFPGSDSMTDRICTVNINRISSDICQISAKEEMEGYQWNHSKLAQPINH